MDGSSSGRPGGGGGTSSTTSSSSVRTETGFYCSTSGTYFSDKESLAEHYKSDFHRYNLKRKVAGLPPVTKEWFEARKAQLTSAAAAPTSAKVWVDPLTKRRFQTQQTYQVFVSSKKYQQLVRDSGEAAPAPVVMIKQQQQQEAVSAAAGAGDAAAAATGAAAGAGAEPPAAKGPSKAAAAAAGFTVKAPARTSKAAGDGAAGVDGTDEDEVDEEDGWETASGSDDGGSEEEEEAEPEDWEEWDVTVSLFDNKRSASMQDNLQYMYRHFGFYLPDAEALVDPEGLVKYLGAKLRYGKVPLYTGGDDANAKQFRSLHAVQRHMVDRNQCKMLYDGNEEEYEDFYDYSALNSEPGGDGDAAAEAEAAGGASPPSAAAAADASSSSGQQLAVAMDGLSLGGRTAAAAAAAAGGWELAIPAASGGGGGKVLGSREFARYYKQRPKPQDSRQSVIVNTIVAQYRCLGVATKSSQPAALERAVQRQRQHDQGRQQQRLWMRSNVNRNLPKNVPY